MGLKPAERLLVRRLLARGLITRGEAASTAVEPLPRRNGNFAVTTGSASYFIKQSILLETRVSVDHEARVYATLQASGDGEIVPMLPRVHGYYEADRMLVLELLVGARTLSEALRSGTPLPPHAAGHLGRLVRRVHSLPPDLIAFEPDIIAEHRGALVLHRPSLQALRGLSSGTIQLVRMLQAEPQLSAHLDRVASAFEPSSFVHGDLRWGNVIVASERGSRRPVSLVDWELAGPGDRRWDLAAFVAEPLSRWALAPRERRGQFLRRGRGIVKRFWQSYCEAGPSGDRCTLPEVLRFAGSRLVQSAYESSQLAAVLTWEPVLLQLALNVLDEPEAAAVEVLGVEPASW